ncbi:MAG TPA: hypothetical protein VGF99_16900 [Myxococcota bacterium]
MAKLTYIIELSQPPFTKVRVVLDGTDVHASHHAQPAKLVKFPNASHDEAVATFQKVIRKYFHPSQGWTLKDKLPGVADLAPWGPPPKTQAELEAEANAERIRKLGYVFDDDTMVIALRRQKTKRDLEIAFEAAGAVSRLVVLTDQDDAEGSVLTAMLGELDLGAAPKLDEIVFDQPFDTLAKAVQIPLRGLSRLVEKRQLERFFAAGAFHWPMRAQQPHLETLSLATAQMQADIVERIARTDAPNLKNLHLALAVEQEAVPEACAAVLRIKLSQLEQLTLIGVPDVPTMLEILATSGRIMPATLALDGSIDDGAALIEVVDAVMAKEKAPTLRFGEAVYGSIDEETITALSERGIEKFDSPFLPTARDERVRKLIAQLGSPTTTTTTP